MHSTIILFAWEHVYACEHFKSGITDLILQTSLQKRKTHLDRWNYSQGMQSPCFFVLLRQSSSGREGRAKHVTGVNTIWKAKSPAPDVRPTHTGPKEGRRAGGRGPGKEKEAEEVTVQLLSQQESSFKTALGLLACPPQPSLFLRG